MARSVDFTVMEIGDFISGVCSVESEMERSLQNVREAVSNTVSRLKSAAEEYRKQLYDIEADENLAQSVIYDAEHAVSAARSAMDSANEAFAKMSEEEQRANEASVEALRSNYEAKCKALEAISSIHEALSKRADMTRKRIDEYESYLRTLESELNKFESMAYSALRVVARIKEASNGARQAAEIAVEALGGSSSSPRPVRIRISNVNSLAILGGVLEDYTSSSAEGLKVLSRSAAQAQFLMESAVISTAGVKVEELEYRTSEATKSLKECSDRLETAYTALDTYLRYGSLTVY